MQADVFRETAGRALILIALISCAILFPVSIAAQAAGDPAKAQMQEMNRRELQLSNPPSDSAHSRDPKRSQAMMDQVSDDFQRILTLHNEMVRVITANQPIDYQFISNATGEIRKRASRLQSSLKLAKPENTTATAPELKDMRTNDQLILLCKQIENFVRNPIIEKPGTIDAEQLGKARRDLETVVELSDAIKKQADKVKP